MIRGERERERERERDRERERGLKDKMTDGVFEELMK